MRLRLSALPGTARLAIGAFAVLFLAFHLTAQATVWTAVGGGALPGPDAIRGKYHGRPDETRLHDVMDLQRPAGDPLAMYWYLDPQSTPENLDTVRARRDVLLGWVEAGAPEAGWPAIRHLLHEQAMCLQCHGFGGEQYEHAPLESLEQVRALAAPGRGIALSRLLVSAHNHVFGFGITALLLGVGMAFTGIRAVVRNVLVAGAFAGAALDVASWFLTRAWGSPWEYGVLAGGALFGALSTAMSLALLDEVGARGRLARALGMGQQTARVRAAARRDPSVNAGDPSR